MASLLTCKVFGFSLGRLPFEQFTFKQVQKKTQIKIQKRYIAYLPLYSGFLINEMDYQVGTGRGL